jgi:tryptophan synthase alpha chain
MDRLAATFLRLKQEGEMGVFPYLMVGHPSVESTLDLVPALVEGGADAIELGVPFSDPLADGVAIQRAGFHALAEGVTLQTVLDVCATLRQRGVAVPLQIMSYYNLLLAHSLERFAADAAEAGADGVIVPDLPPEEAGPLQAACREAGLDLIMLLAPTSSEERIGRIAARASGFLYCVSLTGVTGSRPQLAASLPAFLQRVRRHTDLPLAVGFGISRREHVLSIAPYADAAVVGSALVELLDRTQPEEHVAEAQTFVAHLKGRALEGTAAITSRAAR